MKTYPRSDMHSYKVNLTVSKAGSKTSFTFNHILLAKSLEHAIQNCRVSFPFPDFACKIHGAELCKERES